MGVFVQQHYLLPQAVCVCRSRLNVFDGCLVTTGAAGLLQFRAHSFPPSDPAMRGGTLAQKRGEAFPPNASYANKPGWAELSTAYCTVNCFSAEVCTTPPVP